MLYVQSSHGGESVEKFHYRQNNPFAGSKVLVGLYVLATYEDRKRKLTLR